MFFYNKVVRIIDGDTIDVQKYFVGIKVGPRVRVRLARVDCPELRPHIGTPHRQRHIDAAVTASQAVMAKCLNKRVNIIVVKKTDLYGRTIAEVELCSSSICCCCCCCQKQNQKQQNISDWLINNKLGRQWNKGQTRRQEWTYDELDAAICARNRLF